MNRRDRQRVKRKMLRDGVTQSEVAAIAQVHRTLVNKWLAGKAESRFVERAVRDLVLD